LLVETAINRRIPKQPPTGYECKVL